MVDVRKAVLALAALTVAALVMPGSAHAGESVRSEWITTDDPLVTLHADVQRDADFSWSERQPVILVVTPYGNHSGQTTWSLRSSTAPNGRFADFLSLSGALRKGYTYAVVDLPGFGGSSGCGDLGGPIERAAVKRAVEWAATQPWSNGKVALFGKSYDAWTGLMGVADRPLGLEAVVAMEPVYSPYTVDFAHGVRNARSFLLPGVYAAIDINPGSLADSPQYQANSVIRPNCYAWTQANWLNDDESAAFWRERDLPADSAGSPVPVFLTQGLLETNTVARGSVDYFNALGSPDNKVWFGQFGHYRGWEWQTGRGGFIVEVMRFLDEHLKGKSTASTVPRVSVQDSWGRYRAETSWPPADALPGHTTALRTGSYLDGPSTDGEVQPELVSMSPPLPHAVWLAGEAKVRLTVRTLSPRTNVGVRLFDVEADARQPAHAADVSRDAYLVRDVGMSTIEIPLMAQDWIFENGRRIAVAVGPPDSGWFVAAPTGGVVEVLDAQITLPLLTRGRTQFIGGVERPALTEAKFLDNRVRWTEADVVSFAIPTAIDTGPR
jgi:uncharacterized protein